MLNLICKELNNYFETSKYYGRFVIQNGTIDLSELVTDGSLQENQYFRIVGSIFNDGVYKFTDELELQDEIFEEGSIWPMALPTEVIELSAEIQQWNEENKKILNSPFQSESFGGYSYTKKSGTSDNSNDFTWKNQFASQLNPWRKARCRY